MTNKLGETQKKELEQIQNWCLTILDFMIKKHGKALPFDMFKKVILKEYKEQNLKGLRQVIKDVNEWSKGMSNSYVEELNVLLKDKFGKNLEAYDKDNLREINKILKRGFIKNEEEFGLLERRVDELSTSQTGHKDINQINQLLNKFEK